MKIRQVFAKNAVQHDGTPRAEHVFVVTDDGQLYERFSTDAPGEWTAVPGPNNPPQRRRRKARK
jgi:hypothetical protein